MDGIRYDVVTMIDNFRKKKCADEFINLLTLAKNIDLTILAEMLPNIEANMQNAFDNDATLSINIKSLTNFCHIIQNKK